MVKVQWPGTKNYKYKLAGSASGNQLGVYFGFLNFRPGFPLLWA
jgi:hypothetical protein